MRPSCIVQLALGFVSIALLGGCGSSERPPEDAGPAGMVGVSVGATQEPCPKVMLLFVEPYSVSVGRPTSLFPTVDLVEGGYAAFQWTAPTGTFLDPQATNTKFVCAEPGVVELTLTVTAGDCRSSQSVPVSCHAP